MLLGLCVRRVAGNTERDTEGDGRRHRVKTSSRGKPLRETEGNRKFPGADKCEVPSGHFEERPGFQPLRQVAKGERDAGKRPLTEGHPKMLGGQKGR